MYVEVRRWIAWAVPLLLGLSSAVGAQVTTTVGLERAPAPLGELSGEGWLHLSVSPSGKDLVVFDSAESRVVRFGENGRARGKPLVLRGASHTPLPPVLRIATDGIRIVLMTATGPQIFALDDGTREGGGQAFMPTGITSAKLGTWVVSVGTMPRPGGGFFGQEGSADPLSRLLTFDDDLDIVKRGFEVEADTAPKSGSVAAARGLHLAWSGERLYAAELANYAVYELGRDLKVRATFRDPELELEAGLGEREPAETKKLEATAERLLERQSSDATARADAAAMKVKKATSQGFNYQPVIRDVAWDSHSNRLVLLIQRDVLDAGPALDFLDPTTGEVERFRLQFPQGGEGEQPLTQLAAGEEYIWLRAHAGSQPTWRIDHAAFLEGQRLTLPSVDIAATEETPDG